MTEKEILELSMRDHQKAIDEAKAKLANLDKPELRNGDYRLCSDGQWQLLVNDNGKLRLCNNSIGGLYAGSLEGYILYHSKNAISGNISDLFDDLKAMAEPLEEFEIDDDLAANTILQVREYAGSKADITIRLTQYGRTCAFATSFAGLTEIIQKLNRVKTTVAKKRKENV